MNQSKSGKWLLRKVSGSRGRYKTRGKYSEDKESVIVAYSDLPLHEAVKKGRSYLDTSLIKRWLYSKVGCDFDEVYSEFLTRLQPKYRDQYRASIFGYLQKKEWIEVKDNGEVWGKKGSTRGSPVKLPYFADERFYVDPGTNKVCVIPVFQFRK